MCMYVKWGGHRVRSKIERVWSVLIVAILEEMPLVRDKTSSDFRIWPQTIWVQSAREDTEDSTKIYSMFPFTGEDQTL